MPESEVISAVLASFGLVAIAEMGDKSQLVCMALASRHRHLPVLAGAITAFLLLNTLAVTFGAAVAALVPEQAVAVAVALLFGAFGLHMIFAGPDEESEDVTQLSVRSVFLTTFSMIFVAEFGDKTQIAVAGLAGNLGGLPVWLGASAALITVSGLGVWIGRSMIRRLPMFWVNRFGGGLFLLFAFIAAWHAMIEL